MSQGASIDTDAFVNDGFVVLKDAFPKSVAVEVLAHLEARSSPGSGESWTNEHWSVYDIPELAGAVTGSVREAFDALVGVGEWHLSANWGFPTRRRGHIAPLWHIDGNWFTHHIWSREQVLTPIFLWQDVGCDDSPTLLAPGSHRDVARLIASHEPHGIAGDEIVRTVHDGITVERTVTATGEAGDLYLCHPLLAHTINPEGPEKARIISNCCVHGRRDMDSRNPANAVERAIAEALA